LIVVKKSFVVAAVVAISISLAQPIFGQSDDKTLGKVHFETSCKPDAQQQFDQAMLYQHSFWYRASQKSFEGALKADPGCAIAYWGIALSLLYNPHVAPPVKNLAEGAAALETGKAAGAKTQRERDYIDALGAMYIDYDKVDHRTRVLAYLKAMEQLAQRYPDDDEAQIYYALALNVAASPADKTYANQLKGAAILEKIWVRQPEHPGVAHYLIHLFTIRRRSPRRGSRRHDATPRWRRPRRTRNTCLHTFSPGSATGKSRLLPTPNRGALRGKLEISTISCIRWTIWSMPICNSGRTGRLRPSSTT
jgi:hypothetical protein